MKSSSISRKLNTLAIAVIAAVAFAITGVAVFSIDKINSSLSERLMRNEVAIILDDLAEAREVLVDSGVGNVSSYISSTQEQIRTRLERYSLGDTGRVYVFSNTGQALVVASDRKPDDFGPKTLETVLTHNGGFHEGVVAGRHSLFAVGFFAPWNWHVAVVLPDDEVNAIRHRFLTTVLLILALAVAAGAFMFAWIAGRIVEPIRVLSRRMSSLTEDSLDAKLDLDYTSLEVLELQQSFVTMTGRLHAANQEKKQAEEVVWHHANYDTLTGLPNRRMFNDRIDQCVRLSGRTQDEFALMFLDLDHFKNVNDTFGHEQGDKLLALAARRLENCIRDCDTLARLGGDEFTVLLMHITDRSAIERIAGEILEQMAKPFQLEAAQAYVSVSIGITLYPLDADNADQLIRNADQAMYVAKRGGRNSFRYFTREIHDSAMSRMLMVKDLRHAVETHQFSLNYQPIVDFKTGEIRKAEALIRWAHPTRGWISPTEFIPFAEESGLIHDIGNWLFREVATQVSVWRKTIHPEFQISINTSPLQYVGERANVMHSLQVLLELGLPGKALAIEITEGFLMHSDEGVVKQLLALREAGVEIALDDFGTGYSSLSYLRKFPIDYLKIDRSFVSQLQEQVNDRALCEAIVVMAHKLGIRVVAEGIETDGQRELLHLMGCDFGQGYHFSRPVTAAVFEQLAGLNHIST